jgi:uncharacterized membrane protein
MNGSGLVRAVFVVLLSLYPLVVYFGIRHLPVSFFALVLLALLMLRFGLIRPVERRFMLPLVLGLAVFAAAAALTGSQALLLAYPVLVNLGLCALFALSLKDGEPLLLRVARARKMQIAEHALPYLRRLTAIWAVFFALNAVVAFVTIHLSIGVWAVYNGLISYILVGLLVVGEVLYRRHYKRRMGI